MEPVTPIDALIDSVGRGVPVAGLEAERIAVEDFLTIKACESVTFYFLWRVRNMQSQEVAGLNSSDIATLRERKEAFVARLRDVIKHRRGADELRVAAAGALLELHVLFTTLRGIDGAEELIALIDAVTQAQILRVFVAAESDFAKRTGKALNSATVDNDEDIEEPQADEPSADQRERTSMSPASSIASEDEEPEDDQEGDESAAQRKHHVALLAEQRLCDLAAKCVLAIVAGVVDSGAETDELTGSGKARKSRRAAGATGKLWKRLTRNAAKLGANFKTVVGALQTGGAVGKKGKARMKAGGAAAAGKAAKSKEIVVSEDEEDQEAGDAEDLIEDDEAIDEPQPVDEEEARGVPRSSEAPPQDEDSVMGD